jgi:hypothetical protein
MSELAPLQSAHRFPPRSKMLDTYLGDIGRKLATGAVEDAKSLALSLPHIGVALADENLQSSCDAYQEWCSRWIGSEKQTDEYRKWCTDSRECVDPLAGVPFAALQSLRLRRGVREMASPNIPAPASLPLNEQPAAEVCDALLRAIRSWYSKVGRHDPLVQQNLARLGVLR